MAYADDIKIHRAEQMPEVYTGVNREVKEIGLKTNIYKTKSHTQAKKSKRY